MFALSEFSCYFMLFHIFALGFLLVSLPETPEVCPKIYKSLAAGEVRFTWCVFRVLGFLFLFRVLGFSV